MTEQEKQFLIDIIENNQPIPLDFKYKLFPSPQKEYELNYAGKMRKQDLIRGEDGVQPVPLQIEKVFNGERETHSDGWKNMIVFGDNLQFLKTCNHNEDELIKDKVKGKVKLIYIDPPFGTGDEYEGNKGQKGYTAKRKSTDFVEFIRRRIILSKEILADDGVIFVRQDYHFGHYIKVVLDEVYGKENFINEIVVNRGAQSLGGSKKYSTATDSVFLYSKSQTYYFKGFTRERYKGEPTRTNMYMNGERKPRERTFLDPDGKPVILIPPPKTHWKFIQPKLDEMYKNEVVYLYFPKEGVNTGIMKKDGDSWIPVNYVPRFHFNTPKTVNSNWTDIPGYSKEKLYPTQNSEELLERVIQTCSREGDLILDFFGGSGTTAAVAEKTGRKWIICDIGKLSFYTMQKRILTIQSSKDIYNPKTLYNKMCKSFVTVNVGNYDLGKLFELGKEKYITFVLNLFEIQAYEKEKTLNGYQVCGEKNGSYCFVWEFWKYGSDANVDTSFLEELHVNVKRKVGSRFYIIAPANAIDFIS
ncbi:MAG: site-specific DNA-methyltransferase, partial [Pedobacter sp.]